MILAIISLMVLAYAIEAKHDSVIEEIQNLHRLKEIRKWHKLDFAFHITVVTALSLSIFGIEHITLDHVLFLILIGLLRILVFNILKNLIQERKAFYLGEKGIDGFFRKIPHIYYLATLLLFLTILIKLL